MQRRLRFLGYGVRRAGVVPADWGSFIKAGVEDICSVGDCVSERPEGWLQRWDFNRACCYQTAALAIATANGESGFEVLAYALLEMKLEGGIEVGVDTDALFPKDLPELPERAVPEDLSPLGFDIVACHSSTLDFGCSPLSCNGLAGEIPVNRHCLIDELDRALKLAERFDREGPEPGPYFVVQVLRSRPAD